MWSHCHVIPAGGGREGEWVGGALGGAHAFTRRIAGGVSPVLAGGGAREVWGEYTVEETRDGYIKRTLKVLLRQHTGSGLGPLHPII